MALSIDRFCLCETIKENYMHPLKLFLAAAILFVGFFAKADNGAVAFAYPMGHVAIDGNLADWPTNMTKYSIGLVHTRGSVPSSTEDFQAYFMVGYNLQNKSIYIALEVQDDWHEVDRSVAPGWSKQDKHLLYLDPTHSKLGSCPIAYSATQIRRQMGGSEFSWDPQVDAASWDNVELQILRVGNKTYYEYRVELESLAAGSVLGLDHVIYDQDEVGEGDKYSYLMWGDFAGKSGAPKRRGDLILLEEASPLERVTGHVTYHEPAAVYGKRVRITAANTPGFWTVAKIDSTGQFAAELPYGEYYLDFPDAYLGEEEERRIDQNKRLAFTISDQGPSVVDYEIGELPKPQFPQKQGILIGESQFSPAVIDAFMKQMMDYYAIPGASLGIIVDGELKYCRPYGVKNVLTKLPVGENTIFQAASITKPVFAYTVLRLYDQGVIDLDKPLHQYLPFEELAKDERYKKMTARHVLSHQTGLPNWGQELLFTPGTSHGYSGEGYEYLKRVVEHLTQRSIIFTLDQELLQPFGMTENTYFVREPAMYPKAALGHTADQPTNNWIINEAGMARSMYTEPREFTKFILSALQGEGLHPATYADMLRSQVAMPRNPENPVADWERSFGLGFLIKASPYGKCYGHGGSNRYFQSLFEYYPEKRVGFVVFCNNDRGYYLGNDLREFLVAGPE